MSIEKRKAKYFTEFRHKDYYTPRSMREAYGFEPMLYVQEKKKEYLTATLLCYVAIVIIVVIYAVVLALQF
jgi:hypothetical protein